MQASKIKIGSVYAYRYQPPGQKETAELPLVRFHVTAVVTRRERNTGSPRDFISTVEGYIDPADARQFHIPPELAGSFQSNQLVVKPERIIGPYKETVELAARKKAEDDAAAAEKQRIANNAAELRRMLYSMACIPIPAVPEAASNQPFEVRSYSGGVGINANGVAVLLAVLRERNAA